MACSVGKKEILSIYKQLLRESQKFESYNFRHYAVRRIRDAFKENKNLDQVEKVNKQFKFANENLDVIKRQVIIGKMYPSDRLVIETKQQSAKLLFLYENDDIIISFECVDLMEKYTQKPIEIVTIVETRIKMFAMCYGQMTNNISISQSSHDLAGV